MSEKIEKNQFVMIKSIDHTDRNCGLDSGGIMRSMVGHVFKVRGISGNRVYISKSEQSFQYSWHIKDVYPVEEEEEKVEPIIFKFDEKQLIV